MASPMDRLAMLLWRRPLKCVIRRISLIRVEAVVFWFCETKAVLSSLTLASG